MPPAVVAEGLGMELAIVTDRSNFTPLLVEVVQV